MSIGEEKRKRRERKRREQRSHPGPSWEETSQRERLWERGPEQGQSEGAQRG
jgi:hypothetical protein